MHKGAGLLSCISRSLALGLPLRILRLKHLRLTDEDRKGFTESVGFKPGAQT